jgi:hypothetical protein
MFGYFDNDPSKMLRQATAQKESGDINGAIATLRKAYNAIRKGRSVYPIETFLRLPAYLHEAGLRDEAWQAYGALLIDGNPNEPDLIPMDQSAIYDKMRLFLQREGSPVPAIAYGVLSHCSWAIGLFRQQRKAELRSHVTKSAIDQLTNRLLKRANRLDIQKKLSQYIFERLENMEKMNLQQIFPEVNTLLLDASTQNV